MADVQGFYRLRAKIFEGSRRSAALGLSNCLRLAAAPTFAIMALLTGIHSGSMPDKLCSAAQDAPMVTGMVSMYVLMSIFHSTPWLNLISRRWNYAE